MGSEVREAWEASRRPEGGGRGRRGSWLGRGTRTGMGSQEVHTDTGGTHQDVRARGAGPRQRLPGCSGWGDTREVAGGAMALVHRSQVILGLGN